MKMWRIIYIWFRYQKGLRLGLETFHLGQSLIILWPSIFNIHYKTLTQAFDKSYFSPSLQPWVSEITWEWKRRFLDRKLGCHRKTGVSQFTLAPALSTACFSSIYHANHTKYIVFCFWIPKVSRKQRNGSCWPLR